MDSMYLGRAWFPTGQSGGTAGADVETPTSVALRWTVLLGGVEFHVGFFYRLQFDGECK